MSEYAIQIRRRLHQYPEIGFDLDRTLALVRSELTDIGLPYTEAYGKSSIVATLNEEKSHFTIGIRADMDALPITEKTNVPYKSKLKGQMHACGHDAHTAIVLDTARRLAQIKDQINCRVKFIFQSAEEYPPSGAMLMTQDGVMDDIDCAIALHCEPSVHIGRVNMCAGAQNAVSNGFLLDFYGRSSHVVQQQLGVDAIMMAVKAYTAIEMAVAKEVPVKSPCVFNVGSIHGGESNNSICDHVTLYCTLRTWEAELDERMVHRIKEICSSVAKESGGRFKFTQKKYYPILFNDKTMTERMWQAAAKVVGEKCIGLHGRGLGGEDFAYFAQKKPCCLFRLGVRNEQKACTYTLHQDKFNIDEDALEIGANVFIQFVKDNMNGISF